MNQPLRSTTAVSIVILSSMIAGCAAPRAHYRAASSSSPSVDKVDVNKALASRALAALDANNVPLAIDLAEKAVAKSPDQASVRALLGNAYFAGGRFHSAEAAFRDSLSLDPSRPEAVLKLALVQIAQGKNAEAIALLHSASDVLDPSDYGLAMTLAGRPRDAIAVLEPIARRVGADSTVRQNLALAHAFAGDWSEARTIAAQDVPANQLDARIHQWMQLASPKNSADQVAAMVGVTPAPFDAGEPVQLALIKTTTGVAVAQATPAPAPAPAPQEAANPAQRAVVAMAQPAPMPAPVVHASVPPAPPPPRATLATLATSAVTEAKAVLASVMPASHPAPARKPVRVQHAVAQVAVRRGNSPTVVQLGAYGSPERVLTAWNGEAKKFGALKAYLPMSARFQSAKGTFYRLSVRGFNSVGEANALCASLRREGGKCFVRNFAGDAPVQYASR